MTPTWTDPLHRALDVLPPSAEPHMFAGVLVGVTVADTDPDAIEATWQPDRSVTLSVTDAVTSDELARLLPEFLSHAATLADRPTDAVLAVPSRDVDRSRVTRDAGLRPSSILAVADLGSPAARAPGIPPDPARAVVRDAGPADAAAFAALWWEQTEYEARIGTLRITPGSRAAVEAAAPQRVAGPSTVLVAEDSEGRVVAAVEAQAPADSEWAGTRTVLQPVSYLAMASTAAVHRGHGAAGAIVAELHRRHRAAGVRASLLHYSAYNPLSIPFWSQQGYRPLMTSFRTSVG